MLSEVYICSLIQRRQALLRDGPVAQLNRASDYGSEGFRFESWRGHTENQALTSKDVGAFFIICIQFAYKIGPKRWNESANDGKQTGLWPVQLSRDFGFVMVVWVVVLVSFGDSSADWDCSLFDTCCAKICRLSRELPVPFRTKLYQNTHF